MPRINHEQIIQMTVNHQESRQANGAVNRCSHEANRELWETASEKARALGLNIRHNTTCVVQWIGVHRYIIFVPGMGWACNSRGCLAHWDTPYSRYCKPSISGEAACIEAMIGCLIALSSPKSLFMNQNPPLVPGERLECIVGYDEDRHVLVTVISVGIDRITGLDKFVGEVDVDGLPDRLTPKENPVQFCRDEGVGGREYPFDAQTRALDGERLVIQVRKESLSGHIPHSLRS